ncbi:hypothetical protein FH063_002029 [Azospirillum argentinense]|uniref:Uncharacterized protein n=1 Tax=Azospirillum argentinense TaxID=2970906 RepID=A0A5B0KN75_9PROT|nr:hypothetical protein FH063_002029 [Azospirillum argentinense]
MSAPPSGLPSPGTVAGTRIIRHCKYHCTKFNRIVVLIIFYARRQQSINQTYKVFV